MRPCRSFLSKTSEAEARASIARIVALMTHIVGFIPVAVEAMVNGYAHFVQKCSCSGVPPLGYTQELGLVLWGELVGVPSRGRG